jgi:hypothetical protein
MAFSSQDALSEQFKDGVSGTRSSEKTGQLDWGMWSPAHKQESRKWRKIAGSSRISGSLSCNQKDAIAKAIKQLNS